MGDYISRTGIDRSAGEVFAFVSDIRNMPRYLPTVRQAAPKGEGRVVAEGEANGHACRSDGWMRLDRAATTMARGSDGETDYRGEMRIADSGDGRARAELRVHLTPKPGLARSLRAQTTGDADTSVQEGPDAALRSIRNHCEGRGGKESASAGRGEGATRGVTLRSGGRQSRPDDDSRLADSRAYGSSATMNPPDLDRD